MKKRISKLMISLVLIFSLVISPVFATASENQTQKVTLTPVKILKWVGKAGMYVIKTPVKICKNKIVKKTVVTTAKIVGCVLIIAVIVIAAASPERTTTYKFSDGTKYKVDTYRNGDTNVYRDGKTKLLK